MIKTKDNPIYNLQLNPNNPRTISTEAFTRLKEKIQRNPDGLTANKIVHKDGIIVAGNQRWRAINELKLELQPEWFKDVTDWTDEQIREYLVTSNVSDGAWDWDLLADQYEALELAEWGIDVPDWDEDKDIVEDESPAIDEGGAAVSVPGAVYQLGRHRVMCGDSTDFGAVSDLMDGKQADMVFTDPPYGVEYTGGHNKKKRTGIENDELQGKDLTDLFHDSLSNAIAISSDHSAFYIWYASGKSVDTFASFAGLGLELRAVIQWYKVNSGLGAFMSQYIPNCEPCMYAFKTGHSPQWFGASDEKTVWELKREGKSEFHPTQKPIELCARAIKNSSKAGQVVYDAFLGSGSTLIACEQTDRTCYGMELDPRYVDVVRKRYAKYANGGVLPENWQELTSTIG